MHGGDVDGGFAGAGDAVEQVRSEGVALHRGDDGGEGFGLGFVEGVLVGEAFAVRGERGDVEGLCGFFKADEAAFDEGVDGGVGDAAACEACAEFAEELAAAAAGELGHDGELVVVEFGEALLAFGPGNQGSHSLALRSVALIDDSSRGQRRFRGGGRRAAR